METGPNPNNRTNVQRSESHSNQASTASCMDTTNYLIILRHGMACRPPHQAAWERGHWKDMETYVPLVLFILNLYSYYGRVKCHRQSPSSKECALIADNALSLQAMINTVQCAWRYKINPQKSSILVSAVARAKNRLLRHWAFGNLSIR